MRPTPIDRATLGNCQAPQPPSFPPANPGSKKIFLFLDGTGNQFVDKPGGSDANSNVVKLYTTLKVNDKQIAYYHPGVGTMGDPGIRWRIPRYWSMIKGLAFGAGFKDNVLDAYRYLMQVYNDGDEIYIFGFSRGSYTARALASLLHGYGLLCRGNEGHLLYAWRLMIDAIKKSRKELKKASAERNSAKNPHTIERNTAFVYTFSRIVTIRFMGIWDTVSSVGWIYTPIRLLDGAQNPIIQVGRHAVSIDERRAFYRDNLWGPPLPIHHPEWPSSLADQGIQQDIAQVWFPGAHSDVGGSYAQKEAAPANESLRWMIEELRQNGAELCLDRIDMVLGNTQGILAPHSPYEPPESPDNQLHNSLTWKWWILQLFPQQYYFKDDKIVQWRVPFGRPRAIPKWAIIHHSAQRRLRETADDQLPYKPLNLELDELHAIESLDAQDAIHLPITTANLTGSFILKLVKGKTSFPDDSTLIRRAKLVFGWIFFVFFWLVLARILWLLISLFIYIATLLIGLYHVVTTLISCLALSLLHWLGRLSWIQTLGKLAQGLFAHVHNLLMWLDNFSWIHKLVELPYCLVDNVHNLLLRLDAVSWIHTSVNFVHHCFNC